MKKFKLFLFALLACIILPSSISALEEKTCKVIASDNEKVDATEVDEFVKYLEETVYNLNNGSGILGSEKFTYEIHVDKDTVTDEVFEEAVKVNQDFNSENEAMEYYNNIVLETPYVKKNYKISPFAKPFVSYTKGEPIVCTDLSCVKEMEDLYKQLNSNQKLDYIISFSDEEGEEKITKTYKEDGVVYFNTEAEAKAQADSYKPTLDGYVFKGNTVDEVTVPVSTEKTYEELYGNNVFDTEEKAEAALKEFQEKYNTTNGSIEKSKVSEEVTDSGTKPFETEKAATDWITNNKYDNETGRLDATIKEETEVFEQGDISEEFDSKAQADKYIKELEEAGYKVNYELKEIPTVSNGEVISTEKKEDKSATSFVFSKENTDYILIKQGSGKVAVWTESELTSEEKTTFISTYNQVNSDGSTQGITLGDVEWIYGYGEKDLSNLGNNWKTYTFTDNGNEIKLSFEKGSVSHTVSGGFNDQNIKYVIEGEKYKERNVFNVYFTIVTYKYNYKINATVEVKEDTTKYIIVSNFVNLVKKATLNYNIVTFDTKTVYNLSYDKYSVHNREIAYINWAILSCENVETGNDDVLTDKVVTVSKNDYPNPPQTGVETNGSIMSYVLVGMALYVSYKTYKLVKNN